jgi:uncharacterized protein (TIGR03437 family)
MDALGLFTRRSPLPPVRSVGDGVSVTSARAEERDTDSLVEMRVNGRSAIALAAHGVPGAVDGYQVNFRLSTDTAKGSVVIELSGAGIAGAPVKITVQ